MGAQSQDDPRPGFWETSEYMMGEVSVYIVFVESTGGLDLNLENWDGHRMEQVEQGVYRELWWMNRYPFAAPKLEFYVNSQRLVGYARYEPISRPSSDEPSGALEVLSSINCVGSIEIMI
ncbi:MAG: hypothetical protein QXD32_06535 [Nitrososphaerota archaeon]